MPLDVVLLEEEVPLDVVHLNKVPQNVMPLEEVPPTRRCLWRGVVHLDRVPLDVV